MTTTTTRAAGPCVRCGRFPRAVQDDGPTFLCQTCIDDPLTSREVSDAMRTIVRFDDQRRYLRSKYRWAGGWGPSL